jgi:hypothetical protein
LDAEIALNGRETFLKNFTPDKYYWDLGDGFRASGPDVKHRYVYPGTYHLILGVVDEGEDKDIPDRKSCITRKLVVIKP